MAKENVLIVEDENIIAKDIEQTLKKLGYVISGICNTGLESIKRAEEKKPDIVLMDIMLKDEMDGIEAAEIIKNQFNIPIIFLTAYADKDTLNKAKHSDPSAYIIKPFKEIDLHTAIELSLHKHKKELEIRKESNLLRSLINKKDNVDYLFVRSNYQLVKINFDDIKSIEALKDYVLIKMDKNNYTVHSTMNEIQKKLPEKNFVRVHRSYIINLKKIAIVDKSSIYLEGEQQPVPIGNSYREDVLKRFNL